MTLNASTKGILAALLILGIWPTSIAAQPVELPWPDLRLKFLNERPDDDELRKLRIACYNERLAEVQALSDLFRSKNSPITDKPFPDAAQRLMRAGLNVHDKTEDKVEMLNDILSLCENIAKRRENNLRKENKADFHNARAVVLEVRIEIAKIKKSTEKPKK